MKNSKKKFIDIDNRFKYLCSIATYFPLIILLAIYNIPILNKNFGMGISIGIFLVLVILYTIVLYKIHKGIKKYYLPYTNETKIVNIMEDGSNYLFSYIISYVFPLLNSIDNIFQLITYILMIFIFIILHANTKLFMINIALPFLGYKIYLVKDGDDNEFWLILDSKKELFGSFKIKYKLLTNNLAIGRVIK